MDIENRFNLIDEPWIPIVDVGLVSLRQVFSQNQYRALGGNPVQKIALTKLLLAIAQSASRSIVVDDDWKYLQSAGLAKECLNYLDQWHDRFYLYGEKPFLQMPAIKSAKLQSFGAVLPEISTGNTTVLMQSQIEKPLTDADKAMLIVQLMGFGLGGKKTDNTIALSAGYQGKYNDKGKASTGKPSASIGFLGFLHSFLTGQSLQETLWINLLTQENIDDLTIYSQGLGTAPWEKMPIGENCPTAIALRSSLMGRLIPISRFCLLTDQGLHYSEGIAHLGYKEGIVDPSVSLNFSSKDPKVLWVDPEKRPWRVLISLLSFLAQNKTQGFECTHLQFGIPRARSQLKTIGIWSGGLRISSNAGEQYVSGSDDLVESDIQLKSEQLDSVWFAHLQTEMDELDKLSKIVYATTFAYFKTQKMEVKGHPKLASDLFWQLSEQHFQALLEACHDSNRILHMRIIFARLVSKAYDSYCAHDTARQIDTWAQNRPKLGKYLSNLAKEEA